MKLAFIDQDHLSVSPTNMRAAAKRRGATDDLLPLIRARGVLVPLLVRPKDDPDHFEIVAGRRRFDCAQIVAGETGTTDPLPCAIIEQGDDAAALEASIMENSGRLDPDEVTRWESFTALVRQGRSIEQIAEYFGLPDLLVKRALALGNLLPRIRDLYRGDKIRADTVRHLTLATKAQQRDWLASWDDPDTDTPTGFRLKTWLFGGTSISVGHALFDVIASKAVIVADLFGEDAYFADSTVFWTTQNAAIEDRRAAYLEAGWDEVIIVAPEDHFAPYEHQHWPKAKGGRVYIEVRASGEVVFHEGYVTTKEARRRQKAEAGTTGTKVARPELTSTLQTYVHLHRHAAVRAELLGHPGVALRLMVATAIAQSSLWKVEPVVRRSHNDEVTASAGAAAAEHVFAQQRAWALERLGLDPDQHSVVTTYGHQRDPAAVFARLLDLDDTDVLDILAVVMGDSLEKGSVWVEATGAQLKVDMADWWEADDALFGLLRDRAVLLEIVSEIAGKKVASANATEKTKTLKTIIRAHLDGANGRKKVTGWVPRWMRFAPSAYTKRGGVETVKAHALIGTGYPVAPVAPPDPTAHPRATGPADRTAGAAADPGTAPSPVPALVPAIETDPSDDTVPPLAA